MAENRELKYAIVLTIDDLKKAVKEANAELKSVADETEKANQKIKESQKALEIYAVSVTSSLTAAAAASVNMANKFNEGFSRVATLIPGATARIKELQENVLDLSPAVGKTTQDLTDGLYEIISGFGDSADSAKTLTLAAKAAAAGSSTTKEAIALLSAVTKGYGDTSLDAQKKVSDLAFTTLKLGQTSMSELASSIQKTTSSSKELGVTQEELFSVFASGTGVIGGAAEVATKLQAAYTELMKPGDALLEAFEKLGVQTGAELIQKFGGLQGAFNALKNVADETGVAVNTLFGSAQAGSLVLYEAGAGAAKATASFEAMQNVVGATDEAFAETTEHGVNSFGFQLQQLQLNAQKMTIKLGQELIPALQTLLKPVMSIVNLLASANPGWMALIGTMTKSAVAMALLTTALIGYNKVKATAIKLQGAFNKVLASNPYGVAAVAITGVIVALKGLCDWLGKAKQKAHEATIEAEKSKQKRYEEISSIQEKIKAWAELNAVMDKSEKQKLEQAKLEKEILEKLDVKQDPEAAANKRKSFEELVLSAKGKTGQLIAEEQAHRNAINETTKAIENRKNAIRDKETRNEVIKERIAADRELKNLDETLAKQNETLEKIIEAKATLNDLNKSWFVAESKEASTPKEKEKPNQESALSKQIAEQDDRLKALDDAYKREAVIIENSNITAAQKAKEKTEAENKYFNDRLKLLKTFIDERMQAGASYEKAVAQMLAIQNKTISGEVETTYDNIARIAKEKLEAELPEIKQIAENAKASLEAESKNKFEAGNFGDKNASDAKRAMYRFQIAGYDAKILELNEQITSLTKEDAEANAEKINALKGEVSELNKIKELAAAALASVQSTTAEAAQKAASAIQEYGQIATQTLNGIANLATDIIGIKQKQNAERLAEQLAEIEREKNETLMALENEYLDWKEEKQLEAQEREEARAAAEYEKQQEQLTRTLSETQAAFNQETNIQKAKNKEKELEEKRRALAEAQQKKAEADAEKKRQKEERAQEIEMLNAKAQAQWQFQVATIEAQNAAAQSDAAFARQTAQWQKAQSVTNLIVQTAINTATAAAKIAESFTNPAAIPSAAAYTVAAAISAAQIAVVSAAPIPSGQATLAPLPPAPRPIKFARGGIVYPSAGGAAFNLQNGTSAVAAEAGIPEIILPVNQQNLEAVFKAQGITNNNNANVTIAPTYQITVMNEQGENAGEKILNELRPYDRELLALVENTKRMNYIGD